MPEKQFWVYIMTNIVHTVFYTGVTNDLQRRVLEHQTGKGGAFTQKYHINQLVYFECGNDIKNAILREKQIKAGSRQAKINLVNGMNPDWKDLSKELFG